MELQVTGLRLVRASAASIGVENLVLAALIVTGPVAVSSCAASTVTVGKNVAPSSRLSANRIVHTPWHNLLQKHVDKQGMVDYRGWKANVADVRALDRYLEHLSAASSLSRSDKSVQLAFWINAYNAVTVRGILREYPTSSIRNHTPRLFGYNIWDDLHLIVAGQPYSLNDIEHKILRVMDEPRIHFAIVCASMSCPRLMRDAYVPDRIDEQLTLNAQDFFSDSQKFRFDARQQRLYLSPILKWFAEDFGSSTQARLKRIAPWLPSEAQDLARSGQARVAYLDYDWDLNEQR